MKATIGVYDTHDKAITAVKELKDAGYPMKQLSIIGKAETEQIDEEMHILPKTPINPIGLGTGTVLGTTLGILTGVGLFAIPGLGFLFGAGALVGAIAGFDFGLIGGGIASVLTSVGVHEEAAKAYSKDLDAGRYLVIAQGSEDEVKHAHNVLDTHGTHTTIETH
ncbi:MAG: hypothetical protein JSS96_06095 [Bacteroidetes bacterium]|nr:hypothetical protein [Bacteroidota bacterium]